MPYRRLFEGRCRDYVGCDPFPQSSGVTRCTTESLRFDDASFDAVVTFQVLEHTRHPWRMMGECARVLKTGGLLVLSASFLLPHQDAPCDYFRFTQEGLMELANDADLAVEEFHAHCTALSTLVLLLNCQLQRLASPFQENPATRPLGAMLSCAMFVPLNLLGLVCETRPFRTPADEMNEGFANHLIVCRKG